MEQETLKREISKLYRMYEKNSNYFLDNNTEGRHISYFINFEGLDGCGKEDKIIRLIKFIYSSSKVFQVALLREPSYDDDAGTRQREILAKDSDPFEKYKESLYNYVENRRVHQNKIIPQLKGKTGIVLMDRYMLSTCAYQLAQFTGLYGKKNNQAPSNEDLLMQIKFFLDTHKENRILLPDSVIFLDVPADIAIKRIDGGKRNKKEKFEKLDFLEIVRNNYKLFEQCKGFKTINAHRPELSSDEEKDSVFQGILKIVIPKIYNVFKKDETLKNQIEQDFEKKKLEHLLTYQN